ncbi:Cupin [Pandoravirus kuranda]|uniref:Cupin n=1 Tax=Pandoravirus kuranda TaxID=3019033 RepID=A0AA95J2A3_9VIRU|nr:Cupin [Pandoravirus kuranda]
MNDPSHDRHGPATKDNDIVAQCPSRIAVMRAIAAIAAILAIVLVVITLRRVLLHATTSPVTGPSGGWSLATIDIDDVAVMSRGTLRALAGSTRVPILVRFAVPEPWDRDPGAWARSLAWDRHPFRDVEVRHIWRCYTRDARRGRRAAAHRTTLHVTGSVRGMREGVRTHVETYLRSLGIDDGTWLYRPVAFSHYVARQWLADHPGMIGLTLPTATAALDVGSAPHDAYRDLKVWLNGPGYCTGTHDDPLDNLAINVCGRKRWLLAPPSDRDCFYPTERVETTGVQRYRVRNPYVDAAAIDPDTGDALFPRLASARMIEVDVTARHVLVVPRRWIHFVATTEPSVSFTVNMPSRD